MCVCVYLLKVRARESVAALILFCASTWVISSALASEMDTNQSPTPTPAWAALPPGLSWNNHREQTLVSLYVMKCHEMTNSKYYKSKPDFFYFLKRVRVVLKTNTIQRCCEGLPGYSKIKNVWKAHCQVVAKLFWVVTRRFINGQSQKCSPQVSILVSTHGSSHSFYSIYRNFVLVFSSVKWKL